MAEFTVEPLFNGHLLIGQPAAGYRFSEDPIILSAHVNPKPGTRVLDIGCGCGIMPLILGHRHPKIIIFGVEIQKELARMAQRNIAQNRMGHIVHARCMDIRNARPKDILSPVDLIISNPPYKKKGSGRLNPDPQKAIARHDIKLNLVELFSSARRLLTPRGKIVLIFPAQRLAELIYAMAAKGFQVEWLRFIHTRENQDAKRVVASGIKEGQGSSGIRPPLFIHDRSGRPTPEYQNIMDGHC